MEAQREKIKEFNVLCDRTGSKHRAKAAATNEELSILFQLPQAIKNLTYRSFFPNTAMTI